MIFYLRLFFFCYKAGKKTTDEELEEMLESGNPAIFTSGVRDGVGWGGGSPARVPVAGLGADGPSLCGPP